MTPDGSEQIAWRTAANPTPQQTPPTLAWTDPGAPAGTRYTLYAFDDDGRILISPELDTAARDALGLSPDLRLAVVPTLGQRGYLAKHRERTRAMREASA